MRKLKQEQEQEREQEREQEQEQDQGKGLELEQELLRAVSFESELRADVFRAQRASPLLMERRCR